jgi:precorrin-8X/cobalt-precorrin-8 methylmutase
MPPSFDRYVAVDWSARDQPCSGKDSVWFMQLGREGDRTAGPRNPQTRDSACAEILSILVENVKAKRRTLIGFDFPYGYPAGWAAALDLACTPWQCTWHELERRISDHSRNQNNRFQVAGDLNQIASGKDFPFWGLPNKCSAKGVARNKEHWRNPPLKVSEFRLTEKKARGARPVWQLNGAGCVGGQSLTGIPRLARLRWHPLLTNCSVVWPFETGLELPGETDSNASLVVHAEIFPNILMGENKSTPGNRVKDEEQVRVVAEHFRERDNRGELARLFSPPGLSAEESRRVIQEEGWILGA